MRRTLATLSNNRRCSKGMPLRSTGTASSGNISQAKNVRSLFERVRLVFQQASSAVSPKYLVTCYASHPWDHTQLQGFFLFFFSCSAFSSLLDLDNMLTWLLLTCIPDCYNHLPFVSVWNLDSDVLRLVERIALPFVAENSFNVFGGSLGSYDVLRYL